jgi:hypothetical protein
MADYRGAGIDPTGLRDVVRTNINPATKENQQTMIDLLTTISSTGISVALDYSTDSVTSYQGGIWNIGTLTGVTNDVNISDGGNSITVDFTRLAQTTDAVAIYGSDDGGTTKRIIKTDSGGAIQVDLEVANVGITSFPDNEPFNVAQYGGSAVGAGNAVHIQPGTSAVFQVQSNSANIATETTLAAINNKLVTGTDIGDVTVNNAAGSGVYVQPGTSTTWDVSDRAARLLGVVYGSQGAQLQQKVTSNDLIVTLDSESVAVTGTFWQATQPVSIASMPTTTVTATDFDIRALTSTDVVTVTGGAGQTADVKITLDSESVAVTGAFYQATQPVSLASVPSHAVTNAGTFAVQVDGDALTALQLIDDAVAAEGDALGKGILLQGDDGTDRTNVLVDTDGHVQVDVLSGGGAGEQYADGTLVNVAYKGNISLGTDGSNYQILLTDSDGRLQVDVATMPSTTVTATNLDIRDLTSVSDSVSAVQSGTWNIGTVTTLTGITNVVHVDDNSGSLTVDNNGTFAVQADTELTTADLDTGAGTDTRAVVGLVGSASGGGQLIPGSATDGLLVNLGTNNDVTLATLPDTAAGDLAAINSNTDYGAVVGGGAEATALRVTIANDSTGVLSIDDNGGAITVDGTVAATQSGTWNINEITTLPAITGSVTANAGTNLNTSALALETGGNLATIAGDTTSIDGKTPALGQAAMAASVPVVLANNQTAIPIAHSITGIGHGVKTVTSAGTDEAIAGSTACKKVTIQAQTDNTGLIAVGTSGVDATEATGTGIILYAGDSFELEIDNLADVYIDSTVNGEGVRYTYFT